ncbi:SDR family oxidoreductase [Amycolatopsis rhizosphaerae]|uniref:SDR family oxidoreductase n=1 Tax=Amycolatopsis rhizosphaerae TaxID=2053003 RepID=A0A558B5Y6_9PSEU|nr:SDR family oxidoreductase [Amycolatopsis rhizosphaerae]TVT31927.1 SDR family oxidoreductase [Amycolatopsis rhizosphaerae]
MSDRSSLALVTGAAGGIGEVVCGRLAARGHTLLCVERDQALAEKAVTAAGSDTAPVACDLSDRESVAALCARIEDEWADDLELVFLNAGVIVPGDAADSSAAQLRLQLDVMLCSVVEIAASAARAMKTRGRGHIIATVSMGGILALPGSAAYSAAKAGLRAYLAALSTELRGTGVAVSGIYPSAVDTPMLLHEATHDGSLLNFFGKVSTPDDVADVFERAVRKRRLEHFLPYSDSILCRILQSFPWLVPPMLGPAEAIGRRGRAKYLKRKGIPRR